MCPVLHDFKFGRNQTPSPSSCLLFFKKAGQVIFIKIFQFSICYTVQKINASDITKKNMKVLQGLRALQDGIRRDLPGTKPIYVIQQHLQSVLPWSLIHFDIRNVKSPPLLLLSPSAKPIRPQWRNPASEVSAGECSDELAEILM